MNVAVIGLGLIGGSLAKSIKRHSTHAVWGLDIDRDAVTQALMCGAIDEALDDEALGKGLLRRCGVVLVALYPERCVDWLAEHADRIAPDALVVDCAGVKRAVFGRIDDLARRHGWTYIGGHPMAGREFSGFGYATDTLFERASMILTPPKDVDVARLEAAKAFFLAIGFRSVRITTPEEHDSMIAYTSQLAHIVSGAYVKNPLSVRHKGFSAGSFLDMTRVARLNEDMWTELFLDNADLLVPSIDDLILRLSQYRRALSDGDAPSLRALLREGREKKEALDEPEVSHADGEN